MRHLWVISTTLHGRWFKHLISIYNYLQVDSCQSTVYCKYNLCRSVCVECCSCQRGFERVPCTWLWKNVTTLSSDMFFFLLSNKKGNHFTFDSVFMSTFPIYSDQCVLFHVLSFSMLGIFKSHLRRRHYSSRDLTDTQKCSWVFTDMLQSGAKCVVSYKHLLLFCC